MNKVHFWVAVIAATSGISGCSHAKVIYLINYRNEAYHVETAESRGKSDFIEARSSKELSCDIYVGGNLTMILTDAKGQKERIELDSTLLKSKTIEDKVTIVEIR